MARFYANENIPKQAVETLRLLGHDVLTSYEAGNANRKIPDDEVLRYATANCRIVLTFNRIDFRKLHNANLNHEGIVSCTPDKDFAGQAKQIDSSVISAGVMRGQFLRVNKP